MLGPTHLAGVKKAGEWGKCGSMSSLPRHTHSTETSPWRMQERSAFPDLVIFSLVFLFVGVSLVVLWLVFIYQWFYFSLCLLRLVTANASPWRMQNGAHFPFLLPFLFVIFPFICVFHTCNRRFGGYSISLSPLMSFSLFNAGHKCDFSLSDN